MDTDELKLLTVSSFSEAVGRSERQIYRRIRDGWLKAMKPSPNEGYRIPASEIDRFLKEFGSRQEPDDNGHVVTHEVSDTDVTPASIQVQLQLLESLDFANEKLLRSERRRIALEMELQQHQLLLAENAESLIEKSAQEKCSQERLEDTQTQLEKREQELQELELRVAQLTSENESLWSEKRRPWWKKMFKAQ